MTVPHRRHQTLVIEPCRSSSHSLCSHRVHLPAPQSRLLTRPPATAATANSSCSCCHSSWRGRTHGTCWLPIPCGSCSMGQMPRPSLEYRVCCGELGYRWVCCFEWILVVFYASALSHCVVRGTGDIRSKYRPDRTEALYLIHDHSLLFIFVDDLILKSTV